MVEQGKLALDDKLTKWFPQIPSSEIISLAQILNHSSGIHSFDDEMNDNDFHSWIYQSQSKDFLIQKISSYPLDFIPGTKNVYSNTGYTLLGYIIEKTLNQSFKEALKQMIANPLKLQNTYYAETIDTSLNEVFSYIKKNGWSKWPSVHLSIAGAAGSIISTSSDISLFYNAVFGGKLINQSSLEYLIKTGSGFNKQEDFGGFYGTTGRVDKYFSNVSYFIKDSTSISVCLNGMNYPFGQIFFSMASIYFNEQFVFPDFTPIIPKTDSLKSLIGKFQLRNGTIAKIFIKKDQLYFDMDLNGYQKLPLVSLKNGWLLNDQEGIILTVGKDKNNLITHLTMYQSNQTLRLEKMKD
ncbi:MAG: serine hydrolase domain-containing protein [Sphingobacteriia bacterium]|jgi:D-alanyl-D-alanine carboxypeptidase